MTGVWVGALHLLVALVMAGVAVLALALLRAPALRRWLMIGLLGITVSACGVFLRAASLDDVDTSVSYKATAVVTGDLVLKDAKVLGQNYLEPTAILPIRIEQLNRAKSSLKVRLPARVIVKSSTTEFVPGSRITLEMRFLKVVDNSWLAKAATDPILTERAGVAAQFAQRVRLGLRAAARSLPQPAGGLLPGLVVGDTSRLDPGLESQMRATNLTHLTAVSGANLALVAGFAIMMFRIAGVRRTYVPLLAALAIAGFVLVARPDPSVLRAAVMAAVLIVATALELPALGISALMVAAALLILVDPSQAQRPGFVLSVLATAGLLIFGTRWSRRLERLMPRWLALSLAVPLAAQALCTPYLVMISGQLSVVGIWTNLLVAPAIAPATILGFLAALTSVVAGSIASVFAWLALIPIWWVATIARVGAALPFANIRWSTGWLGVLLAALVVLATYLLARWRARYLFAGYAALILLLALLRSCTPLWPMKDWSLAMCDVGQGDGLVLRTDPNSAVVIDAGPDPVLMDRCLRDLDVRKVELVILTHNHADHVEGLPGVLRGRGTPQIWLSPEVEPLFETARVKKWVTGLEVATAPIHRPVRFPFVRLLAIWPTERLSEGSIPNNASIVLIANWQERSAVLLGDVEIQAQQRLHIRGPIDVLKVAHHGSANQDFALLDVLDPTIALISVGAVNPYGHPSAVTLQHLNLAGARIFRSDRDGTVALAMRGSAIKVAARGHPWWRQ